MENIYAPSYYRILCVGNTATAAEIKTAWRGQMKVFHEDVNQNDPGAKEKSQKLNEAHTVLSDVAKRKEYDAGLTTYIRTQEQKQKAQAEAKEQPRATHWHASTPFATRSADNGLGALVVVLIFLALAVLIFNAAESNKKLSYGTK